MNEETAIQRRMMVALSEAGVSVWRNETGVYWSGKVIHRDGATVTLANASRITAGLCVGSSDLIGVTPVTVTADMVGKTLAVFTAIEVKTATGRVSPDQARFIDHINRIGGQAGVARTTQDAVAITKQRTR